MTTSTARRRCCPLTLTTPPSAARGLRPDPLERPCCVLCEAVVACCGPSARPRLLLPTAVPHLDAYGWCGIVPSI